MTMTSSKTKTKKTTKAKGSNAGSYKREAPTGTDKQQRKSRIVYDWDYHDLSQYFHLPQRVAAKYLDVSVITIKRCCKRHHFDWPYRALKHAAGNKPVLSARGRAFQQLPVSCMLEGDEVTSEEETSECETDTESVEGDDQQRKDLSAILLLFHDKSVKL
ncbi:Winged helix-turn-helix DNA-binding domain [Phytophthora cinnamomi]|uniref:Winged helix-turn-helix DNA-binding domain n=1 Tax=Phytophthora cinnamomi TaxID=4785 RepID=UPI002A330D57|nr:Winged helix-turn-helix DNA-binding domain [Phytophthora cinnamomi]KAJ8561978.1 hypothetical protein ON010_g7701 [Phytophthora cinnamomi]